jgi:ribosomal protein L37E
MDRLDHQDQPPPAQAPRQATNEERPRVAHAPDADVQQRRAGDRRVKDLGPPAGLEERRRGPRRVSDVPKPTCPRPGCNSSTSVVVRSRPRYATRDGDDAYHRMRVCAECGKPFPTTERLDDEQWARMLASENRAAAPGAGGASTAAASSEATKGRRPSNAAPARRGKRSADTGER